MSTSRPPTSSTAVTTSECATRQAVNLAGREPKGNSLEAMDLGFLLQSLSLERVATDAASLVPGAQPVPDDLEREIARRFVRAMGAHR